MANRSLEKIGGHVDQGGPRVPDHLLGIGVRMAPLRAERRVRGAEGE